MKAAKNKTLRLTLLGILSAVIVLQNFVPFFGYIPIQPFNPTIIHITVIVGAVVMGMADGAILGLVWGFVCLLRAFFLPTSPIDPIVFTNPMVSVFPRVMIGVISGCVYTLFTYARLNKIVAAAVTGVIGSFVNTILVLGFIYLFYRVPYANFYQMDVSELLPAILVVVSTNGLAEAVTAGILVPCIARPLTAVCKINDN